MKEYKHHRLWSSVFTGGSILVALLSVAAVIYIPFDYQWLNSLVCAMTCFFVIWLHARRSHATQNSNKLSSVLLLMGIAEVILSVLFLRSVVKNTSISIWMYGLIFLSPIVYTYSYRLLFVAIFPRLEERVRQPAPDPLSEFPESIREIMKEGQRNVNNPVAFSVLAFTLLGAVAYIINAFISGEGTLYLLFVPAALGYLTGFILGIRRAYKWQHWARQSGCSEQELKAAARAAHLWWPRTRERTRLEKPGKFTGS
jgi:hypothetical protein